MSSRLFVGERLRRRLCLPVRIGLDSMAAEAYERLRAGEHAEPGLPLACRVFRSKPGNLFYKTALIGGQEAEENHMGKKELPVWDLLAKRLIFEQIGPIRGLDMLDFGNGDGAAANHFAGDNRVVAIEPSEEMLKDRFEDFPYTQWVGSGELLKRLSDASMDFILCHNVLEYVEPPCRPAILSEFSRILRPGGTLSIVKHNRAGRVMQMVVLLNNFSHARQLLQGEDGKAAQLGAIRYYEVQDLLKWCPGLKIEKIFGFRTFWDLQQNQEIQREPYWQEQMLSVEREVSGKTEFQGIAFFHHILLKK